MTGKIHVHEDDVPWGDYSAWYPEEMLTKLRAKRFVGPDCPIPMKDTLLGLLELDPGAEYPAHRHASPELYYVTQGQAECRFGDEVFTARKGSIIHTRPNVVHAFKNTGEEPFVAIGFWWMPAKDGEELDDNLELLGD